MFLLSNKAYIVAEIGGNFNDKSTAEKLIDDAVESGVDAVKLQTYKAENLTIKDAVFDMENTGVTSQLDYFKKYELDEKMHKELFFYAREKGLEIFSTPSHIKDLEMLEELNPDVYKIGADDLTNLPFLKAVAKLHKKVMLSTGMGCIGEIHEAVDTLLAEGNKDIIIMHVVSLYPTPSEYVNLNAINTLKREFPEFAIGYSDHTMSIDACLFAAVMGAQVIEKHFTYDKKADGPDHMHSATKEEMKRLVSLIREFEAMKGDGIKSPQGCELKNRINNRKSIVYTRQMRAGEIIHERDVDIKRPGYGIEPKYLDKLIGKELRRDVEEDTLVRWGDL